ncbi:MAG: hypothetical protein ACPGGK_08050 [Pikeienuella sp.]
MKNLVRSALIIATLAVPITATAQNVTVDGDGWVSVDGREIGRVYSSWGWVISCKFGYVNGSGSFKADVNNKNEAISVLLRSCKY